MAKTSTTKSTPLLEKTRYITRVRTDAHKKVHIEYFEGTGPKIKEMDKRVLISKIERAQSSFYQALHNLVQYVPVLCELPKEWEYGVNVMGVQFDFTGSQLIMGARIEAQKRLKQTDSVIDLETPFKYVKAGEGILPAEVYPEAVVKALERVQREANDYLEGAREQKSLFDKEAAKLAPVKGITPTRKASRQMALA